MCPLYWRFSSYYDQAYFKQKYYLQWQGRPLTPQAKSAIKRNSRVYRKWVDRGRNPHDRDHVRKVAKLSYYFNLGNKLSDPNTGQKKFWTAFKKLANQKKEHKYSTNRHWRSRVRIRIRVRVRVYVSNFKQKAGIFNEYFANQCTIMIMAVCYRVFF